VQVPDLKQIKLLARTSANMTSRMLVVAVCLTVVIASSALPAPRVLPGQTLHLDQAQVRTFHRARLAAR